MMRIYLLLCLAIASIGLPGHSKLELASKKKSAFRSKPTMRKKSPDRKSTPYRKGKK